MSGLIWAGIGKGIADAGTTFGGYMAKDIEATRKDADEALREERLLKRQEALDQLKADREEIKLRKDADIYAQAETNAPAIGDQRRFEKFKADVGQTDMAEADLKKVFEDQYNQKKVGTFEGADRYVERYSKQKEDTLNEIRRLGGSSAAIKEGRESYKATTEAEVRADKDAADRRREDRLNTQMQNTAEYQTGMVAAAMRRGDAAMVNADAATTRANRPSGGGGGGSDRTDRDITAAENALSSKISRVEKDYPKPTMQQKYDPELKAAYDAEKKRAIDNDPDVKRQRARVEQLNSGYSDAAPAAIVNRKTSDNAAGESRASSSAVARPTTKAEFDKLPSGSTYVNPADGLTYRKK